MKGYSWYLQNSLIVSHEGFAEQGIHFGQGKSSDAKLLYLLYYDPYRNVKQAKEGTTNGIENIP